MAWPRFKMRRRISEIMGDYRQITMTGGSTTTAVSAEIRDYVESNDSLGRWHMAITTLAGTTHSFADRTILRQSGYAYSSDTVTVGRTFGGTVASGDVGELHRYSPTDMNTAIEAALSYLYSRGVYLPVADNSLVVDNEIHNGDFEDWDSSTAATGWTASGGTQTQNGDRKLFGRFGMQLAADSGGDTLTQNIFSAVTVDSTTDINLSAGITATQTDIPVDDGSVFSIGDKIIAQSERMTVRGVTSDTIFVDRAADGTTAATHANNISISFIRPALNVVELVGKKLRFEGYVWASAANAGRLRVTFDGSTYNSSGYHAGDDEWQGPDEMSVEVEVPAGATQITVVCDVAASQTVYFDGLSCVVGNRKYTYKLPSSIVNDPRQVLVQADRCNHDSPYFPVSFSNPVRAGHRIKLVGKGTITPPTAETSLIEVSDGVAEVVATKAAAITMEMHASGLSDLERDEALRQADIYHQKVNELLATGAVRSGYVPLTVAVDESARGSWDVSRDGEAATLTINARA